MHNYVLVGAGGTGTMLLRPLYTYLKAHHAQVIHDPTGNPPIPANDWMLWIIDGDVVEESNLTRQLFPVGAILMNKAHAAAGSLADEHHVQPKGEYLNEDNLQNYIRDGDTVLICADNFTVRKRIEEHALTLDNITVINGGNERFSGSVQLWVREGGEDKTPRIGFAHPEIAVALGEDRAEMTCAQAAALPGGEQTIIANMQAATWMLTALYRAHHVLHRPIPGGPGPTTWTELQFDILNGSVQHIDMRLSDHWNTP